MGNNCSSKRRDRDNGSLHSEEYQLATQRKNSQDSKFNDRTSSIKNGQKSSGAATINVGSTHVEGINSSDELTELYPSDVPKLSKNGSAFAGKDIHSMKTFRPTIVNSQVSVPDRVLTLPGDINELSYIHKQLLLGVVPVTKPTLRTKKIVIYICAADSEECHVEKNLLHGKVYPELRKMCREEGFELHIVDLHWRSQLEKRRDHKFPELCIYELKRHSETSYILPIIFLNNSLGVPLLPRTIDCQDYENTLQKTQQPEVLKKWYKLQKEAEPPCYVLQTAEENIPNFNGENEPEREKALKDWNNEVENILKILVSSFSQELRDIYLTTTIEQEIHNTMRISQELAKRSLWIHRTLNTNEDGGKAQCEVAKENKRRLASLISELKNELGEKNIIDLEDSTNEENIKNSIYNKIITIVKSVVEDDKVKNNSKSCYYGVDKKLLKELMLQTIFCQKLAAAHSINNYNNTLKILKNYVLSEDERGIMVIHGSSGSGKSSILSRFLLNCQTILPNLAVIFRYINISADSSSLELILHSMLQQLHHVIEGKELCETHSISKYVELFPKFLSEASENRPILIVIDGIDQLHEHLSNIDWIPVLLPRNIKFVFSITNIEEETDVLEKLRDTAVFVDIPLLKEHESETVFNALVAELDGPPSAKLPEKIRSSFKENSLPLFVKIVAHQFSWMKKEEKVHLYSTSQIERQINALLDTLEINLGKAQLELALSLLMAARFGLTDSEMLDLLSYEDLFHSETYQVIWAPACIFLAEFNKFMKSFLRWFYTCDSIVMYVQHEVMREILLKRYKYRLSHARQLLHTYFTGSLWDSAEKLTIAARVINQPLKYNRIHNTRKLEELPYHEFKLFNTLQRHFLEDHIWLYNKVCACSVFHALEDVKLEATGHPDGDANLSIVQLFFESYASTLNYDGRQFYSQFLKFLYDNKRKVMSNTSTFLSTMRTVLQKPPVYSLLSFSDCIRDRLPFDDVADAPEEVVLNKKGEICQLNIVKRVEFVPNLIVTVSTGMGEISVWDVSNGQIVRKLINVPQPMALEMIDAFRCVVLCNRELRIYDLNNGNLISKLKGVMNQKMPFFGLHDPNHLVALSRNRMYVNVMNLETGDVVTSFKAGEDRFLNSLLVSGNGKILVCGDETQKPFPLLVWNLASRKLLYDLRITHHDFITQLAAITYEGNYVCCVAKEVDEPSPNFIVVYDLQSGTMFKKWKPGVNCVSLDISSVDSCVLSGHQNGTISIWDLVTGACKWTLEGHTAPVTCMRLNACGGSFLSMDSSGRDRSIRLWNLTTGELTAVYTPNKSISAAEILAEGKYVVIGTMASTLLTILHLVGPNSEPFCPDTECFVAAEYGVAENYGKTFDLNVSPTDER